MAVKSATYKSIYCIQLNSMHRWWLLCVNHGVTRIALWVCLCSLWGACLPTQAADQDLNTLLKGMEQRYNRAKTLQVQFLNRIAFKAERVKVNPES